MSLRCLMLVVVFTTEAASGVDVMKAVGDEVSFRPDKPLPPSVSSFIWKHRNSDGVIVKVIEWDNEDGFNIPNLIFKDITTLDVKTGQITITKLKVEHSGVYTIDINMKQQETSFSLIVKEPVPKPVIEMEKSDINTDVVYERDLFKGVPVMKAVGDEVSFRPDQPLPPSVSSFIWKHRNSAGVIVKAIEWDNEDGFNIPNPRFQGITTLDEKTGQITITKLNFEHSGVYTIDINRKEQETHFTLNVKGVDVMKAVGDEVSFRPDKPLPSPVSSFIWKHRNSDGVIVKAIEWDNEDGFNIPNIRFQGITTLDEKTGQITITKLKVEHSGVYTIDINIKQQETNFSLTVKEQVPKPVIETEKSDNPDVVYLRCEYSEPIIWKNSAEKTLTGSPIPPKGEFITVVKKGDPENFYTCTLDNSVSKETSEKVNERSV